MIRKAYIPHDLEGVCAECGTTLTALATETGIPEATLQAFARCEIGLSAQARLAIIEALNKTASPAASQWCGTPLISLPAEWPAGRRVLNQMAHADLVREALAEAQDEASMWITSQKEH